MEKSVESRRLIVCCVFFAAAVGVIFGLLNLPARVVRIDSRMVGMSLISQELYSRSTVTSIEKAGWPLTYRICVFPAKGSQQVENQTPVQTLYFSWFGLFVNVMLAVMAMGTVAWYTRTRQRHIVRSDDPNRTRRLYDFTTASCGLAVPVIVLLISSVVAKRHHDIAARLVDRGQCTLAAEVPKWMADRIPKAFSKSFFRLTDVRLIRPTDAILDQLNSVDTLRSVSIQQSNIDSSNLHFLGQSKTISSLTLAYCRLDSTAIKTVASMDQLRWLSLHASPISDDQLRLLNQLSYLEGVDLSQTGIRLSEFDQPAWSHSVRNLRLSRPTADKADHLSIRGWDELSQLSIQGRERRLNNETLTVELVDCPKLTMLHLDRWQKHSLIGVNLPMLRSIYEPAEFEFGDYGDQTLPSLTRWSRLDLQNLPSLPALSCQANDLESIRLSDVPRLRSISIGNSRIDLQYHRSSDGEVASDTGKLFSNAISEVNSLKRVSIRDVPLDREDLQCLCRIPFLHELECVDTQLNDSDLVELETKNSLRWINLGETAISEQRFINLLKLPRLQTLRANLSGIEQMQIAKDYRIESLETRPMCGLRTLELMDLPRYSGNVVIQNQIENLRVRSVPNLRELIVECPWPKDYTLEGVDGLLRFAAGGANLCDSLIDQLARCRELDQLSLAYPSISREKLIQIGEMKHLTALEVPGCPIDDRIVSHWSALTRLRRACFDDTAIGVETIRWLSTHESLRSVSLNYLQLDEAAQEAITILNQVTDLSLVQTEMSDEAFARFLQSRSIEFLNLSNTEISLAKLEAIARSSTLRYCVFNHCGLSPEIIERLLRENSGLHIEVNNARELPSQRWASSVLKRLHDASTSDRWSHRIGRQYRSTIRASQQQSDRDPPLSDEQFVSRPFSLALFRKPRGI